MLNLGLGISQVNEIPKDLFNAFGFNFSELKLVYMVSLDDDSSPIPSSTSMRISFSGEAESEVLFQDSGIIIPVIYSNWGSKHIVSLAPYLGP